MAEEKIGCCPETNWAEPLEGCSTEPAKRLGCTNDPGTLLMPVGYSGNPTVGLKYVASPQCGDVPGGSFGMTRRQWIEWTTGMGRRVDPVEPLEDRLKAAGLYEYALTEPTGEE